MRLAASGVGRVNLGNVVSLLNCNVGSSLQGIMQNKGRIDDNGVGWVIMNDAVSILIGELETSLRGIMRIMAY